VSVPATEAGFDSPIGELIAAIEAEQARAERPRERQAAPALRQAPPAVPHRIVQQLPERPRQAGQASRPVGNPLSELIGTLERRRAL